jgi:hypothetical protein
LPALKSVHLGEPDTLRKFFKQQLWHANRNAYKTILAKSGMKAGGNAPKFTAVFLVSAVAAVVGLVGGWFIPGLLVAALPLPLMLLALAARTSVRAGRLGLVVPLTVLYGAYGVARCMDLVGLVNRKTSWKAVGKTQD